MTYYTENIFYSSRDHEAGPGEWCIRSTRLRGWKEHIGPRKFAILFETVLNNMDKYPEFKHLVSSIEYSEKFSYEHKDDVPPRKVQEELNNIITSIMNKNNS